MKKVNVFIVGMLFLLFSVGAVAQDKTGADYFAGKWDILVKGTPNGDAKMVLNLEEKDNAMTGVIQDSSGVEISKISAIEIKEQNVTVYFTSEGYDIYLSLNKVDEDHIKGSLLDMFDAEGERIR
jgi:hypothetical protein